MGDGGIQAEAQVNTPNAIRSEIGFAVWMFREGWRGVGGRGYWRRELKRLINDPTVYECNEEVKSDMCPECGCKHGCL